MTTQPLVSVIIPNYNHAPFLKHRIESVLNQTFQDFELIFLDDCSKDESREIIEKYSANSKVGHVLLNKSNSGSTFKQWNRGFGLAKGEYFWIAESDDYADPLFLEKMIEQFKKNTDLGIAYCQSYRVNENNEILGDWQEHTNDLDAERWKSPFVSSGTDEVKNYFAYKNIIPNASSAVFSRKALEKIDGANEDFILNGDWLMYLKVLASGYQLAFIPDKLNYFREHSMKVTRGAVLKGYNILEVFKILKYIISLGFLQKKEVIDIKSYYCQHYLPQIFRKSVPDSIKRRTLLLALNIAPVRAMKCIKNNLRKV